MKNGIINIYKERGFTSHDVVAKLRGILKQKKIGHTGTLDPDAEGVLPVCLGKGTKLCELLTDHDKTYEAVLLLGQSTDTQDVTGTVLEQSEVQVTEEQVRNAISGFTGTYDQVPPMYSALKVGGKKLCDLAREGKEVVQLYISDRNGTPVRPEKELKGFSKVSLKPGETKTVTFEICARDLSYYEEQIHDWYAPAGAYRILVGHASDDIVLEADIEYQTDRLLPLYADGTTTVGDLLSDPRTSQAARQIFLQDPGQTSEEAAGNAESEADLEMLQALLEGMPLKSMVSLGAMSREQEEEVIAILNGILGNEKRGEEK